MASIGPKETNESDESINTSHRSIPPADRLLSEKEILDTITSSSLSNSEVKNHLENLALLETKICKLLNHASEAISNLNSLDNTSVEDAKLNFKDNTKKYFTNLEIIGVELRKEIRDIENNKIIPSSINTKTEWVGKKKREENIKWFHDSLSSYVNEED